MTYRGDAGGQFATLRRLPRTVRTLGGRGGGLMALREARTAAAGVSRLGRPRLSRDGVGCYYRIERTT